MPQEPGDGNDGDRDEGVEQRRIGRRGVHQRHVSQGVVRPDTQYPQHSQDPPLLLRHAPQGLQMGPCKRQGQQQRQTPARESQAHGRNSIPQTTAHHHVA